MSELPEIRPCDTSGCGNWIPADRPPAARRPTDLGTVDVYLCDRCRGTLLRPSVVLKWQGPSGAGDSVAPEPRGQTFADPTPEQMAALDAHLMPRSTTIIQPKRRGRPPKVRE